MEPCTFVFYTILFVSGMTAGILLSRTFQKNSANSSLPAVRVGKSNVSGRGVFALKNIQNGAIIERCPVLEVDEQDIGGELLNYVFYGDNEKERLVAMGNGMLFNHSSVPNVAYYLEETPLGPELVIYALRDLRKGEELFYTYGDDWWTTRNIPEIS
ncbi:MAG: SET domain-containing protein-lysine N-methyltransferase [Chlorobium phaeobacteroides]|uniref:Nuclear protein SET n=1 Tax=Chlorobium phaeobacteroides (strain BS1) TaxID=331678 RepID=B3EJN9_CHLPB|nr:SET domain-containing protein-lysine N-methyltransferase [Chlorobium phaeobacteroides]MBL6956328.1 SET domain-containing protein-lysine N-methyltransferase [Chlorobium phaeobacteroides]